MRKRKSSLGHNKCEKDKSSKQNNHIETYIKSMRAKKTHDDQCASMGQQKELTTINKPL